MMMNKPTIPREVADAIEKLRDAKTGWTNERIVKVVVTHSHEASAWRSMYAIPFDTLLAALVNGYDVEKTAEEIAHERIREQYAYCRRKAGDLRDVQCEKARWIAEGIKFTLDALGVKITGVNA